MRPNREGIEFDLRCFVYHLTPLANRQLLTGILRSNQHVKPNATKFGRQLSVEVLPSSSPLI